MTPKEFSLMDCSVARTLEIVGERWTILILRDAFYGVRRFDDFQADLGVARNILTDRLKKLVEHGVLERRPYEERPPRYEYRLTEKGKELLPVLLAMMSWGDKWGRVDAPPATITHRTCGHETNAVLTCEHCGEVLSHRNIVVDPIPIKLRRPAATGS